MHVEVVTDPGSDPGSDAGSDAGAPGDRNLPGGGPRRPRDRVFALATPEAAVVVTTALAHRTPVEGCGHGTGWYLRRLGAHLLARLTDRPERPIRDCLSDAIAETAALHGGRCDLALHGTPTASIVAVRLAEGRVDQLVLGPGTILTRRDVGVVALSDPARHHHAAGARPSIAADAAHDTTPCRGVHTIALINGGGAESLHPDHRPTTIRILEETGAHGLLAHIRAGELRTASAHHPVGIVHLRPV
ncbi:hypothetical protein [Yinghuangia seranimata]|uniref:hypothetical protein n=1 Tax=Yinghuangia seranimata TaxID=408067 RepID=UPI00248C164C|nr:hypothetical protein [Yinghuangia seranimata]MDI2128109.1 hypothetical protein [Yinghuangia seranimata]